MCPKNPAHTPSTLIPALTAIVGAGHVLASLDERDEYAYDAFSPPRATRVLKGLTPLPDAVARPGTVGEVQEIVRLANRTATPIVPYGGGTGVLGGAIALQGGIVVDLKRLDRVLHVDRDGLTVTAQAGIVLKRLDEALAPHGLMAGHDPWSVGIATVGGAISTGGFGYFAARLGGMGEQVLGLEVVLPNGDLLPGKQVSAAAGPRLHPLFIGAEGTLGIITGATLRVMPIPEHRALRSFLFPDFESGFRAIVEIGQRGVRPTMLDYSTEGPAHEGTLHLAFLGFRADATLHDQEASSVCSRHGGRDLGPEAARGFWDTRHATAEAWAERMAGGRRTARNHVWSGAQWFDYLDPAVPADRMIEYKRRCEAILAEAGLQAREFDIWGRPDLFTVVVMGPEGQEVDPVAAAAASEKLMTLAQEMGGTMEWCHGVGVKLQGLAGRELGPNMDVLRVVKRALDPNNIMNPGKLGL